jgi:hypothetical protein
MTAVSTAPCANCGHPLTGRYCAHCGERRFDPESLTVRHFVTHTLVDEVIHLDGRFWRTLRNLLFRPGVLSTEYTAGRRRPYVKPVRLLIAAIITYALLTQGGLLVTLTIGWLNLSVAPTAVPARESVAETVRRIDRFGVLGRLLASKQRSVDINSPAVQERFHRRLNQFAQPLSFANVFLLALALYLVFRRRRPLLLAHAVFSMHFVSFVLVSSLALLPAMWVYDRLQRVSLVIILAVFIWQFTYLTIALRRFYFSAGRPPARPKLSAAGAAMLIYILNSAFLTIVQIIGGAIALRSI